VLFAQSASAISITPGGPAVALAPGNFYNDAPIFGAGVDINNQYNFTSSGLSTTTTAVALNSNPPAQGGNFGIKNLHIEWFDSANATLGGLDITDSLGVVIDASAFLSVSLPPAVLAYHLLVTGKSLVGGSYILNVSVPGDRQSDLPLPPALLLFGSALLGLTALGRRRRGTAV